MQNLKRVNVILVKDIEEETSEGTKTVKAYERLMRTTKAYAQDLVKTGNWRMTTKAKLQSFLKRDLRLLKNERTVAKMEEITGEKVKHERIGNNIVAKVPTFKHVYAGDKKLTKVTPLKYHIINHQNSYKTFYNPDGTIKQRDVIVSKERQQVEIDAAYKYYIESLKKGIPATRPFFTEAAIIDPLFEKEQKLQATGQKNLVINFGG